MRVLNKFHLHEAGYNPFSSQLRVGATSFELVSELSRLKFMRFREARASFEPASIQLRADATRFELVSGLFRLASKRFQLMLTSFRVHFEQIR